MKTCEHLEGKEIVWADKGCALPAVVRGLDHDIGWTITHRDDPDFYLTCTNGPASPQAKHILKECYENWEEVFAKAVEMIETGFYDVDKMRQAQGRQGGSSPSAKTCSFI